MNKFTVIVYPRGFLGYDIGIAVPDNSTTLSEVITAVNSGSPLPKKTSSVSNTDVQALWNQFCMGLQFNTSFQFREKVFLAALKAFGTDNIYEWVKLQQEGPYYTDMHRRFLNDTFNFIIHGKRALQIQQWANLIEPRETSYDDRDTAVKADEFFDFTANHSWVQNGYRPNPSIESVIQHWCAKEGGLEDMLATLHIFFGNNSAAY